MRRPRPLTIRRSRTRRRSHSCPSTPASSPWRRHTTTPRRAPRLASKDQRIRFGPHGQRNSILGEQFAPQDLYLELEEALQSNNVAFDFCPAKFKFTCEFMVGTTAVKFVARAYRVAEGRVVVEFQRRMGCCLVCAKVLEAIREHLFPSNNREAPDSPQAPPRYCPRITEVISQRAPLDLETLKGELEAIKDALSSDREDVRREFSMVLIPLSQSVPAYLCREQAYSELVATLASSPVVDIRLPAISCIANLAATMDDSDEAASWFPGVLCSVVQALGDEKLTSPHVRREAARALMYMSRRFSGDIKRLGGLEELRKHSHCQDRMLQGYVDQAVRNLVSVC
jgi:hypothetical protein